MSTAISEVKLFSRFLNIRSKAHHGQALDFIEELMGAAENPSAEEMMIFLMDQHGHNQSEMTDIAPRTVINAIIHGKRKLNRRHIEGLCRKYRVSADLFIGGSSG